MKWIRCSSMDCCSACTVRNLRRTSCQLPTFPAGSSVCVLIKRKLTAPEWQGKDPQWGWNLHTNWLLIDLHLIWSLKLHWRVPEERWRQGLLRGQDSGTCSTQQKPWKGKVWLGQASQPEAAAGGQCSVFPFKTTGHSVWPLSLAICVTTRTTLANKKRVVEVGGGLQRDWDTETQRGRG